MKLIPEVPGGMIITEEEWAIISAALISTAMQNTGKSKEELLTLAFDMLGMATSFKKEKSDANH